MKIIVSCSPKYTSCTVNLSFSRSITQQARLCIDASRLFRATSLLSDMFVCSPIFIKVYETEDDTVLDHHDKEIILNYHCG